MIRRGTRPAPGRRALLLLSLVLSGLLALGAASALAVPGTQTYTGGSAATPDIERTGVTLFRSDGSTIATGISVGTLNFSLNGGPSVAGYCIDTANFFETGSAPNPVDITTLDPPTDATQRALAWILVNRVPTGEPTDEKRALAATAQVATWLLVDGQISRDTPTSDAALNAASKALVAEALAATAVPNTLGVSASAPAAGATTSTITVTGRPGATVALAVTAGSATLSASSVVIGAGGSATATLTAGPGSVTVSATTAGEPRLVLVDPVGADDQATAVASPTTLTGSVTVAFTAAGAVAGGPGTPTTPVTTPGRVPVAGGPSGGGTAAPQAPALRIAKAGPRSGRALQVVRYTIVVRNTGGRTATNVVLRDRLPRGMSFVRSNVRSRVSDGSIVWNLGSIAPGRSRTVQVFLLPNAGVRGDRTNVATVSGTRLRPVSARTETTFRPLVRRTQPAVTG